MFLTKFSNGFRQFTWHKNNTLNLSDEKKKNERKQTTFWFSSRNLHECNIANVVEKDSCDAQKCFFLYSDIWKDSGIYANPKRIEDFATLEWNMTSFICINQFTIFRSSLTKFYYVNSSLSWVVLSVLSWYIILIDVLMYFDFLWGDNMSLQKNIFFSFNKNETWKG